LLQIFRHIIIVLKCERQAKQFRLSFTIIFLFMGGIKSSIRSLIA
jgi:hypothetical protein